MQDPPEPDPGQPESTPSFSDQRVRGALADETGSPAVEEIQERIKKTIKKVQWGKLAKIGALATGIPSMIGLIGFGVFNYLYPQKVHDFFIRRKKTPSTSISTKQFPRPEGKINSRFNHAEKLIAQGNNTKAQALLIQLLKTETLNSSQQSKAWNRLGKLYVAERRIEEAHSAFQQSIEADPGQYESYVDRAVLLRDQGDWNAALATVTKALDINPDDIIAKTLKQELISRLALEKDQARPAGPSPVP